MTTIPVRLGTIADDQVPYWDAIDDRVVCTDCAGRSGPLCTMLRLPCFPADRKHRCAHYARRVGAPRGSS